MSTDYCIKVHVGSHNLNNVRELADAILGIFQTWDDEGVEHGLVERGMALLRDETITDAEYERDAALDEEHGEWVREHVPSMNPLPPDFPQV